MKKRIILSAALILLVALLSLFSVLPLRRAQSDNSTWMARLDDSAPLNTLSIPGTHNAGSLYSFADVYGKCQTLPIKDQLTLGVRLFDIRLRLVNDELCIVHSIADQMTDFDEALGDMLDFLRKNPSEFLLVSIKQETAPKNSKVDFVKTLEDMLRSFPEVSDKTTLPKTVREARGLIHILSRYENSSMGLPCYDGWIDDDAFEMGEVYVQDNYKVKSEEEKIADVEATLRISEKREYELVLNFASCYFPSGFPPVYAGIPTHDINAHLLESLPEGEGACGVILCDFITSELAEAIIRRNFE